jgi:DNA topoisomerase-1
MVVEREREIQAFVPVEYWSLDADLSKRGEAKSKFTAGLTERAGQKLKLGTGLEARQVQTDLDGAAWKVAEVKEREQLRNPAAPFTTSTLQQEASRKLSFTAKRTMAVAQQLYEGVTIDGEGVGLITYMRTDSVTVADSAKAEARDYISQKLGADSVPKTPREYRTRSRLAQEAHEAIRPTSVFREPDAIKRFLTPEQARLYDLIWKRFVASQMASAIFDVTTVEVDAQAASKPGYRFRATGSRLKFRGFLALYLEGRDDEEVQDEDRQPLPELKAGEVVDLLALKPEQHFTQPPPRYTEATLVKAMEEHGIGRPSTYAPTLSTIVERGYVDRDARKLTPTDLGMMVNDILVQQFGDIVDVDFTATMEGKLDEVAEGTARWVPVVEDFYKPLDADLKRAEIEVEKVNQDIPTDEVCSEGHPMVIKAGRFGKFLACTQYPEHKETRPLAEELPQDAPEESCSHDVKMQLRTGRFGPFYTSTHDCGETKPFAPRVGVACPTDGGDIVEKRSRKGKVFFGCNNWPNCDWVSWYRPLQEPCPECGGLQIDLGRGRTRCLKHEGEMPSRFSKTSSEDGEGAAAKRNGTARTVRATKGRAAASSRAKSTTATRAKATTTRAKATTTRAKAAAKPATRAAASRGRAAPKAAASS